MQDDRNINMIKKSITLDNTQYDVKQLSKCKAEDY